jgi:hypothetical protein
MVGQDLLDLLNDHLGGYQNATTEAEKLRRLNEGKDRVWEIIRQDKKDYFIQSSQATTAADDNYFATLTTTEREFDLPDDFQEMKLIEVTTSGYEDREFIEKPLAHPDFQAARRTATAQGSSQPSSIDTYMYAIVGKKTMMFAQYLEAALTLKLWYVRSIPDFELAETIDEILFPYSKKIAEYAAKRILAKLQDEPQSMLWDKEWRESVQSLVANTSDRADDINNVAIDFIG